MPPKASSSIDRAWAESFEAAISRPKLPQGAGWLTLKQIREKYRLGEKRTYKLLKSLISKGLMQMFVGYIKRNNKQIRQIWYRPAKLGAFPQNRLSGSS